MAKTAVLNIRVKPETKKAAEELYESFGITITDAVNMFLNKSLMEKGLPFDLKKTEYNAETIAAIDEGKRLAKEVNEGKLKGYSSAKEIFDAIGV
jgi:DNA-damage-inducible protein J